MINYPSFQSGFPSFGTLPLQGQNLTGGQQQQGPRPTTGAAPQNIQQQPQQMTAPGQIGNLQLTSGGSPWRQPARPIGFGGSPYAGGFGMQFLPPNAQQFPPQQQQPRPTQGGQTNLQQQVQAPRQAVPQFPNQMNLGGSPYSNRPPVGWGGFGGFIPPQQAQQFTNQLKPLQTPVAPQNGGLPGQNQPQTGPTPNVSNQQVSQRPTVGGANPGFQGPQSPFFNQFQKYATHAGSPYAQPSFLQYGLNAQFPVPRPTVQGGAPQQQSQQVPQQQQQQQTQRVQANFPQVPNFYQGQSSPYLAHKFPPQMQAQQQQQLNRLGQPQFVIPQQAPQQQQQPQQQPQFGVVPQNGPRPTVGQQPPQPQQFPNFFPQQQFQPKTLSPRGFLTAPPVKITDYHSPRQIIPQPPIIYNPLGQFILPGVQEGPVIAQRFSPSKLAIPQPPPAAVPAEQRKSQGNLQQILQEEIEKGEKNVNSLQNAQVSVGASDKKVASGQKTSQQPSASKQSEPKVSPQKESAQKASPQKESPQKESAQKGSPQKESAQKGSAQKGSAQKESPQKAEAQPESSKQSQKNSESKSIVNRESPAKQEASNKNSPAKNETSNKASPAKNEASNKVSPQKVEQAGSNGKSQTSRQGSEQKNYVGGTSPEKVLVTENVHVEAEDVEQEGENQGEVVEGEGEDLEYVIEEYTDGSKYEGQKLGNLRHGHGVLNYFNGGVYEGGWKEGKMDGPGKMIFNSGKVAYEGVFRDDKFEGRGVLYNEDPEEIEGEFTYNDFSVLEAKWTKYDGEFKADGKDGYGTLYLSNGSVFEGNFVEDKVHGEGVFTTMDGSKIHGVWAQDALISINEVGEAENGEDGQE